MKRYSQRSGHTAMAELNVTPLLDLAFVLLIIFIITTPLLESNMPLQAADRLDARHPAGRPEVDPHRQHRCAAARSISTTSRSSSPRWSRN